MNHWTTTYSGGKCFSKTADSCKNERQGGGGGKTRKKGYRARGKKWTHLDCCRAGWSSQGVGSLRASEVFAVGKYKCTLTHTHTHRYKRKTYKPTYIRSKKWNCVTAYIMHPRSENRKRRHLLLWVWVSACVCVCICVCGCGRVELMVMQNICTQIIFQGLKLAFIRKLFFHMHAFSHAHTHTRTHIHR